jgi:hypothetical protein
VNQAVGALGMGAGVERQQRLLSLWLSQETAELGAAMVLLWHCVC